MLTLLAATVATCVMVISPGTNGNENEKYKHERAHCNGWSHAEKAAPVEGKGYKSFPVPSRFDHPYKGRIRVFRVDTDEAKKICGGHFACQWFE